MQRLACGALAAVLSLWLPGCSVSDPAADAQIYRMGDRVQLGPLTYTVLDTDWLDQAGQTSNPRLPQNRFFAVRVAVTNTSAATAGIPPATIVSPRGESFTELTDAQGVPEWLGYIRSVKGSETIHGRLVFDAPTGPYKLKLAGEADPDNEKTATVDLPLQFGNPRIPSPATAGQ